MLRTVWPLLALADDPEFDVSLVRESDAARIIAGGDESVFHEADIIILSRILGPDKVSPFTAEQARGCKVVLDLDDDLTDDYRAQGFKPWLNNTCSWVDAITVSTVPLAQQMERYQKPITVLPNLINTDFYAKYSDAKYREVPGLTIGLVGTSSHFFDWAIVVDTLKEIKRQFPDINVLIGGYAAPYFEQVSGAMHMPFRLFNEYPLLLRQLDIRLVPLDVEDRFNESKSAIAALEAAASARPASPIGSGGGQSGCLPICSSGTVYDDVVSRGTAIGVENTTSAWVEVLSYLIRDDHARERLSQRVYDAAMHYTVDAGTLDRAVAYRKIVGL